MFIDARYGTLALQRSAMCRVEFIGSEKTKRGHMALRWSASTSNCTEL